MSGVTMLVRWLCSSPASELLPLVGRSTSFFPGLRKCTPRQKRHVNQQAASFQRPPKRPAQVVLLSLDWARNAPYYLDKVRVREGAVGPSFSQTATSRVPGYGGDLQNEKAKTKASDPIQRRIAKGKSPDHQARRRSRKETLSQVAQHEGERVIGQHEENAVDEDS